MWVFSNPVNIMQATVRLDKVRKMGTYTVMEMLSIRYDNTTRMAAVLLIIVGDIALICAQIMAFAGALSGYIGVNQKVGSIIVSCILNGTNK